MGESLKENPGYFARPWGRVAAVLVGAGAVVVLAPLVRLAARVDWGILAFTGGIAGVAALLRWLPNLQALADQYRPSVEEAQVDPLGYLEGRVRQRTEEIHGARTALKCGEAQIRGLHALLVAHRRDDPEGDLSLEEDALAQMETRQACHMQALQAATRKLARERRQLKASQLRLRWAAASHEACSYLLPGEQVSEEILAEAATRSVQRDLHGALAELECAQLEFEEPSAFDVDLRTPRGSTRTRHADA